VLGEAVEDEPRAPTGAATWSARRSWPWSRGASVPLAADASPYLRINAIDGEAPAATDRGDAQPPPSPPEPVGPALVVLAALAVLADRLLAAAVGRAVPVG
jgi:hypothetical protein